MPKRLLTQDEIKQVNKRMRSVFKYITDIRKLKFGDNIKFPQIPPIISESLAFHLLNKGVLLPRLRAQGFHFEFGGRVCDILAIKNKKKLKIEVKATGKHEFQYFGKKDINADYMIWINYKDFYFNPRITHITLYTTGSIKNIYREPVKIRLNEFLKKSQKGLLKKKYKAI